MKISEEEAGQEPVHFIIRSIGDATEQTARKNQLLVEPWRVMWPCSCSFQFNVSLRMSNFCNFYDFIYFMLFSKKITQTWSSFFMLIVQK